MFEPGEDEDDVLEGAIEAVEQTKERNPAVMAAPPSTALVREAVESEAVRKARESAERASKAAERARLAFEAFERAESKAKEQRLEAQHLATVEAEERREAALAAEQARIEAMRPPAVEYEIEVLDIFDEGRFGAKKAIEFVVRGAPNFASYRGGDPVLRAYVYLLPVSNVWWKQPSTYYPFVLESEATKQLRSGGSGSTSLARERYPRSRSLDGFYANEVVDQKPRELTAEIIEAACGMVLKEHLDMVDAERARLGEPSLDRSFVKQKMKVRS